MAVPGRGQHRQVESRSVHIGQFLSLSTFLLLFLLVRALSYMQQRRVGLNDHQICCV